MEKQIFLSIHDFRHPILDILSIIISDVTEYAILWILIAVVLITLKKQHGWLVAKAMGLALIIQLFIVNVAFKILIDRPRPYIIFPQIEILGKTWVNNSFPSGHVASTVAMLWVLTSFFPKIKLWAIIFTLLMMWSRIYNGMHWPSDVVGGALVGLVAGWLAIKIIKAKMKQ